MTFPTPTPIPDHVRQITVRSASGNTFTMTVPPRRPNDARREAIECQLARGELYLIDAATGDPAELSDL